MMMMLQDRDSECRTGGHNDSGMLAPMLGIVALVSLRLILLDLPSGDLRSSAVSVAVLILAAFSLHPLHILMNSVRRRKGMSEQQLRDIEIIGRDLAEADVLLRKDLMRGHMDLNARMVRLSALLVASRELVSTRSPDAVVRRIVDLSRSLVGADTVCLSISPEHGGVVFTVGDSGVEHALELSAPVIVGDETIGVLTAGFDTVTPETSENGSFLSLIASYAGIALENANLYEQLSRANLELRVAQEYAERLVEEAPVGIVVTDQDGVISTWNRQIEAIVDIPRQFALGKSVRHLPYPELADAMGPISSEAEKPAGLEIRNCQIRRIDGQHIMLRVIISTHPSAGECVGYIIMIEDVTEKVRLGEHLKRTERLRIAGEFAAGMAHEINNPIATVSVCAQVLRKRISRQMPPADEIVKTLGIIEEEATRCSSIVGNLLTFSRQSEPRMSRVDLGMLALDTAGMLRARADHDKIAVIADVDTGAYWAMADSNQLKQVFLNIGLNALEAMADGGRLTISVNPYAQAGETESTGGLRNSGFIEVSFADTGPGMDQDTKDRVFTPFFTTKPSGTGLGLSLSLAIVESHGGRMEVDTVKGMGSTFRVVLPAIGHGELGSDAGSPRALEETLAVDCEKTSQFS